MDIAVVGTGIAGLTAAHHLYKQHRITCFEAGAYIGGHTHTVDVTLGGKLWPVDTGFIVFNHQTYPRFTALLAELGVASRPSSMSFSVTCPRTGQEYNGTSLNTLFARRRNLISPRFWGMIADILRFNKDARAYLTDPRSPDMTLGRFLARGKYGDAFVHHYILPMAGAVWSAGAERTEHLPMRFFASFFENHGMLSVDNRPEWRVVAGGSRTYVARMTQPWRGRVRLNTPVQRIRRAHGGVYLRVDGEEQFYDAVVLAVHADQALYLLADPSDAEREVLRALPYQPNEAVLHTDTSVLPRRRLAWAAWNAHLGRHRDAPVAVTYNMNILQGFHDAPETFCVTLNHHDDIDPARILQRIQYAHPVFGPDAPIAQARFDEISGVRHTYYCGAYWFNGFHEDGVRSGMRAAMQIAAAPHTADLPTRVAG